MDSREVFSLEGIGAAIAALDRIEKEVEEKIDKALEKLAKKVIFDAKKLAPIDSGDLEAALIVGEVKKLVGSMFIDFGTSPEVDEYATVQHEGFRKTKEGKVIYMSPGPKTESKASYKGYMPGKKYLENAIKINEKLIIEELSAALKF
jgi:HK97 gp10 family phage protein